ncbi:MAG: hypothetical protein R2828_01025 [Saprospiraceae bacterium]
MQRYAPLMFLLFLVHGLTDIQAQSIKTQLLTYLDASFGKLPITLAEASYQEIAPPAYQVMADTAFKKQIPLIQLLGAKARLEGKESQQAFAEWSLGFAPLATAEAQSAIWGQLKQLQREAFSPKTQDQLKILLLSSPSPMDKWVMLAGFATKDTDVIRNILLHKQEKYIQQACRLALARMGEKAYTESFLKNIKKIPVEDNFIYEIAPLVIYVRDKAAIAYLMELVIQDKGSCRPADAETDGKISCGYRLVEMLSPILIDFPLKTNEEGELQTADYPKALAIARTWMKRQKQHFQLDQSRY